MIISDNSISYLEDELKRVKNGEIIIELNETRNKVDIQTLSGKRIKREDLIKEIQALSKEIHHGKVIINLDEKEEPRVNVVNRERFQDVKKDIKKT